MAPAPLASAATPERLEYKNWALAGSLTDNKLGQAIALPEGSTLNGSGELNTETGAGSVAVNLSIPHFSTKLKLLGLLPVTFGITLTQASTAEGVIARSEAVPGDETLTIPVTLSLDITSLSLLGLTIPTSCAAFPPVSLALVENLPREELLRGSWHFGGTAKLPHFSCEGGFLGRTIGFALTNLLSGPENPYSITATPPTTTTSTTTTTASTTATTGTTATTTTTTTTTTVTTTTGAGTEILYVANAGSGPVEGYNPSSSGAVAPVREADNPQNPNTVWDPWGVAIDHAGNIYVQSFLSDATTFVFAPEPIAGVAPIRIFRAYGPDSRAIAVDGEGYEYVASGEAGSLIAVAAPGAGGPPGNLYSVEPVRTFTTGEGTFNPWPDILTVSGRNLLVAVANGSGNAVETYEGGASGSSTPLRVLGGSATGLGACESTCDHVAITNWSVTGNLYAAVSGGGQEAHVNVFAGTAAGNTGPLRTIEGSATGLDGKVITGIAVSRATGEIFVMVKSAEFESSGQIDVFGRESSGNVAPTRTFTDISTAFANAMGIAIGP
jgi:hypothetical protein